MGKLAPIDRRKGECLIPEQKKAENESSFIP